MNFSDLISLGPSLLQLAVMVYTFRLVRMFGLKRVGWSVVSAFLMLTVVRYLPILESLTRGPLLHCEVEVVGGCICVLLLAGQAHVELLFKERTRLINARQESQVIMERKIQEKTAQLTQANAELSHTANRLTAEAEERKRMQEQMERTHRELIAASREAGMSEVATGVLHNVGNVLNSVNVSANVVADHLAQLKVTNISRVAQLLTENAENIGHYLTEDPRGRQLPGYLAQLGRQLSDEQILLNREVQFVMQRIDHIKEIVATQQSYGRVSGVTEWIRLEDLVEDVLRLQSNELEESQIQLQRNYEPGLPEVVVDRHKVLQILLNLMVNAKQACLESSRPDKCIDVRVALGNNTIQVQIADNGVGILAANIEKIFNHGFTTKKKGGHGFGLHSGALAAKEMGGQLSAYSPGVNCGAAFLLELPLEPGNFKTSHAGRRNTPATSTVESYNNV